MFKRPLATDPTTGEAPIVLYPNPAHDVLTLKNTENNAQNNAQNNATTAHIIDVLGRPISTTVATNTIDIKNLPNGVYAIQLYNNANKLLGIAKFIKE